MKKYNKMYSLTHEKRKLFVLVVFFSSFAIKFQEASLMLEIVMTKMFLLKSQEILQKSVELKLVDF